MTVVDEIGVDKKLLSEAIGKNWIRALRLPIVQREFVWDSDKIRDLIDSIVHDYPIGTVILWETEEDFPGSPIVDTDAHDSQSRMRTYVVDGQQRLTSLLLISERWKLQREGTEISTEPIRYNPTNRGLYVGGRVGIDISLLLNAALGDVNAIQELSKEHPGDFKRAVDDIGTRVARYPLPIYTLKTKHKLTPEEEEKAAEEIAQIFTRVNRSGERLGNLQLFLSFFAAAFSDLKKELIDSYRSLNDQFGKEFPRWEALNRFVFGNLQLTQSRITRINSFTTAIKELKEEYGAKPAALRALISKSQRSAAVVLRLVNSELGIYTPNRLPSQNALVPLMKWAFLSGIAKSEEISAPTRRRMMGWLVVASFQGYYGSKVNTRLQTDLETVESGGGKAFPLSRLLSNMKRDDAAPTIRKQDLTGYRIDTFRSDNAAMLLNVVLFRGGATNWAGQPVTSRPENSIHHIFPREYLRANDVTDPFDVNELANCTVISSQVNSEIGDTPPADYLPTYDGKYLKAHFIPTEPRLWTIERYDDFLTARKKLIWEATKDTLQGLSKDFS